MRLIGIWIVAGYLALAGSQAAAPHQPPPTFPFPANLSLRQENHKAIDGNSLLLAAIHADLNNDEFGATAVELGSLGKGAIVSAMGEIWCGATGNCDIRVYYLDHGHYRSDDLDSGWAYAVVKGTAGVPDLVVMRNMSYLSGVVTRFSYLNGRFEQTGCDEVERKEDGDILDPKQVVVRSCGDETAKDGAPDFVASTRCGPPALTSHPFATKLRKDGAPELYGLNGGRRFALSREGPHLKIEIWGTRFVA